LKSGKPIENFVGAGQKFFGRVPGYKFHRQIAHPKGGGNFVSVCQFNKRSFNMSDKQPVIAQKSPFAIEVEAGKSCWWCSCGKSATQPFCDGSHKGSDFSPVEYKADKAEAAYFCGCKHSANGVMCDGTHKKF
jgi:CDGSH-type Zn-finger protein